MQRALENAREEEQNDVIPVDTGLMEENFEMDEEENMFDNEGVEVSFLLFTAIHDTIKKITGNLGGK